MSSSPLIDELIDALRCLPGVGPKSAQRMAYHLLHRDRDGARRLAGALNEAADKIGHCTHCRTFSETDSCSICADRKRDESLLCIVENPGDVLAIEQVAGYRGKYFVLLGHLSPLDGIGPRELGLDKLAARLDQGDTREVIIATSSTVEGEATAHYIGEMTRQRNINASRIAHGVPLGGELEYVNGQTLMHAFSGRRAL